MPSEIDKTITKTMRPFVSSLITPPLNEKAPNSPLPPYLRRLEQMAFRDYLTQLLNRCAIDFAIDQQLSAFHRYEVPFSVLLADLDDFKRINDRYGHPAGDRVLRAVAESLRSSIRGADIPGRWGGEEFMVIAPFTDGSGLPSLAERIHEHIATAHVRINHSIVRITASIGATVCRKNDDSHSLIERVDNLLYESKSSGKNWITCR